MYQTQYEEELEINDFPQSCRWKVTSREAIGNITDFSEADIQIRGVYYPPGKEPGEGMFKNITSHPSKTSQNSISYAERLKTETTKFLVPTYNQPKFLVVCG